MTTRAPGQTPAGFPTPEVIQRAYDEAELGRAIQAYRFFYPTVSMEGAMYGQQEAGAQDNQGALLLAGGPRHVLFTGNSDTPYLGAILDLWEWIALNAEASNFELPSGLDVEASDRWFAQAIGASPAMIRRTSGAGSLYWLALRDRNGVYLDGGKTDKLTVPQPVPARLFWSAKAYGNATRSQIQTEIRSVRQARA